MSLDLDRTDLAWLRHLARALVAEPHAAEDLMQDTLLAASCRSDVEPKSLRGWLAGVARRLAARRYRDSQRRERREAAASPPQTPADPVDLVARAEQAEQLASAARRLPEPMRTAVLLRFLEDRDVSAIAAQTGKPVDTVRYRIRRGLDLLRRDLGGSQSDEVNERRCRALLLPLAAPPFAASTVAVATSTASTSPTIAQMGLSLLTFMKAKTITVAALAVLLISTFTLWPQPETTPVPENGDGRVGQPVAGGGDESRVSAAVEASERTLVPMSSPKGTEQNSAPSSKLLGVVVDEEGVPVAGALLVLRKVAIQPKGATASALASATSNAEGRFELPRVSETTELLARRNGFCRTFVVVDENAAAAPLQVVMRQGGTVVGRVLDSVGRGVPNLECIAYTEGAGIEHMSPTQSSMRAREANAGPSGSGYEQCRARTDKNGHVRLTGLAEGKVCLRSLDPAWTIERPTSVATDGGFVLWSATSGFGVELVVRDADGKPRSGLARGRFYFEAVQSSGERHKLGKWVGRGEGKVTWGLTAECVPFPVSDIREVVFYGEAGDGTTWTEWRSQPVYAAGETVRVRVDLPAEQPAQVAEQPAATLELQVFGENGVPWQGEVFVRWRSLVDPEKADASAVAMRPDGRHRLDVPAGKLAVEVQQRFSSGSIQPWRSEVFAAAGGLATAMVKLPLGATAAVTRPSGYDGTWRLHASYRTGPDEEWFGSWNYGTDQDQLVLNALQPAEWRFELRRSDDPKEEPIVRTVTLRAGERQTVSR